MTRAGELEAPASIRATRPGRRLLRRPAPGTGSPSLLTRVIGGSIILSLLVAGSFLVVLIAMSNLRRSTNEQARSRSLTQATLGLERVVNELEVSLRSFAISNGDERFLSAWREGRGDLPAAIGTIKKLNASEPAQARQVDELSTLIHDYVTEYGRPLIRIARIDPEAARSPVATREGLARVRSIRDHLSALLTDEDGVASASAASAKVAAARAVRVGLAALVAVAALILLFGLFLARGIARPVRTVADGASKVAGGDLSTRLPEGGAAEIDTLTRAFNAMARSVAQGKRELETQNEELRESHRLMSQLVSIVSHELRTPLASILGYTSVLLKRDVSRNDSLHYLEIIHEQGKRLESLVDEFLDGEAVKTGQIELKDEPVDLKPLLVAEARLLSSEVTKHRITVAIDPDSLPVRCDRRRITQVISNLLTNAVKYSPDGGLVEVEAGIDGGVVRVQVRDEGLGVSDEHQARIFTTFFRGDARKSGISGTGLGLAVSREIVEAHGGRIGFTSRSGSGSAFWFELPLGAECYEPTPAGGAAGTAAVGAFGRSA